MFKKDCEHTNRFYICLWNKRLIFENFKYVGWYRP